MKVQCLMDNVRPSTDKQWLLEWAKSTSQFEITVGKIYSVLAVTRFRSTYFIYIISDESNDYPLSFPAEFFKITDTSVSKYWDCEFVRISSFEMLNLEEHDICSFKEWKEQKDLFYERLLDGDKRSVDIFINYRDKINSE